jgi:hypothetical protein
MYIIVRPNLQTKQIRSQRTTYIVPQVLAFLVEIPVLTTDSMNLLRQQMDESNHEMVNLLTQQIGTVFNPLIRDTSRSYQALTTQIERIADCFAPPQPVYQPVLKVQNQQPLRLVELVVQRPQPVPQPVEPMIDGQPEVVLWIEIMMLMKLLEMSNNKT